MRQPEGFKARGQENKVICLQRALYGLKQAGLAWWKELNSSMNKLGFKRLVSVVFESPVRSGYLALVALTETETS
jgi:Reverse transcriptase (RNA-dependent DNA polymerase)